MSQHTPGPWKVIDAKGAKDRLQVRRDGEISKTFPLMIAHVYDFDDRKHKQNSEGISFEVEANARLIAAAPDLLAALKGLNAMSSYERDGYCVCPANSGLLSDEKHSTSCADARTAIRRAEEGG